MKELAIPPAAAADPNAAEIVRIWIADGGQHVTLHPRVWKDPAAWGLMLVDLARHVAIAYEQTEGCDRQETLARIKAGFDAEWDDATDEPMGKVE